MKIPFKLPVYIDGKFLCADDCELISKMYDATDEECQALVEMINAYPLFLEAVELLKDHRATMFMLADQIQQMRGLFSDEDGTIQESLEQMADSEKLSRELLEKLK